MCVGQEQEKHGEWVQENSPERQLVGYQPSLPGQRALLVAELQRAMRADEVVVAPQQRQVIHEMLGKARMARAPAAQV